MSSVDYEKTRFGTEKVCNLGDYSLRVLKVRRALSKLAPRPMRVLDLGCGEGALTRTLSQSYPTAEVHGCDISQAQLGRAEAQGGDVIYRRIEDRLPYDDAYFDAIFIMDVLEHVDDPGPFLAEVFRVIRTSGQLLLHCPCEGHPFTLHWLAWKLGIGANLKHDIAGHVQRFSHRSLKSLILAHGFELLSLRYSYHPFGQAFDLLAFSRQMCQLKRNENRANGIERAMVALPWYRVFPTLERLAGIESRVLGRLPLAMGIDACFRKK